MTQSNIWSRLPQGYNVYVYSSATIASMRLVQAEHSKLIEFVA